MSVRMVVAMLAGSLAVPAVASASGMSLKDLARISQGQRNWVQQLQAVVDGEGMKRLEAMMPPEQGIGIDYGQQERNRTKKRSIVGVQVERVLADSPAGRLGVVPGGWLVIVNGTGLCNVLVEPKDHRDPTRAKATQERLDAQIAETRRLLAEAPDTYAITVQYGSEERTYTLTRGPVAPAVAQELQAYLPIAEQFFRKRKPDVDALAKAFTNDASSEGDLNWRFDRLKEMHETLLGSMSPTTIVEGILARAQVPVPTSGK